MKLKILLSELFPINDLIGTKMTQSLGNLSNKRYNDLVIENKQAGAH